MRKNTDKFKKAVIVCIAFAATSGCATIDRFKKMPPNERATLVCNNQIKNSKKDEYKLEKTINGLKLSANEIQKTLNVGYRVHTSCTEEPEYSGSTTDCRKSGWSTVCDTSLKKTTKTVCTETPVPINHAYEIMRLKAINDDISSAAKLLKSTIMANKASFDLCYQKAYELTPEAAYWHYKNDFGIL